MKKPLRKIAFVLIVFGLIGGSIYASGILVKPNFLTTKSLDEVPVYDILSFQAQREQEILAEVRLEQYSFSDPYVIIDPYEMNPLSALVAFEVDSAAEYVITVLANHAYAQLTTRVFYDPGIVALPIIGLFPDTVNTVLIDNGQSIITLSIETEPLPLDFQKIDVIESKPEQMQEGFTLFVACFDHSYTALVDQDGAIRAYFSNTDMAHGTSVISLPNGHLLGTGDELKQVPYNMTSLWEFDWLGRVYQEIELPNGAHHDLSLLPDGKVLVVSNHERMFETGTREDVALIVDLQTGDILTTYDFRTILDETRAPFNNFHPNILNALNIDWMHMNGAVYDPQNDWLIVSSPIQSQVVAIDAKTKEIQWILGPHEGYEGSSAFLKSYLLTPIGEDFQWQWA
ncbi:MAG: aryl-sulfate sulfotransferase, partial [Erysipelotrichaceae bacterium]|nr:aryl-sulfate sulfotransferase [Erysipelotrichaceae bacterium]